jgi:hypothetical protein
MNVLWTTPLGPIGLLLGGGGLLLALQRHLSTRWRQILPVALVVAGMAAWLLLRFQPQGEGQWWVWLAPLELKTALGLQWNGWVWVVGWLLFLAALTALVLPRWRTRPGFSPPAFWTPMLLAASLLVITATTWSTLLSAWALMVLFAGLLVGTHGDDAPRAWTMLLLSVLFLLAAPLFNGVESLLIVLSTEPLNLQAQLLLLLAVVIPLGVYPFHLWLDTDAPRPAGQQLALQLLPALAALYMLGKFQLPLLSSLSWIALVVAGLLGSAMAAWLSDDHARKWLYVTINRATWVTLALSLFRNEPVASLIFPLTTLALSMMIWALVSSGDRRLSRGWARWLALVFMMGFPFTTGFALNHSLSRLATSVIGFPVWVLVLASQTLLVAAVLHPTPENGDEDATSDFLPANRLVWTMVLVVLFGVWWGFFPSSLARTVGLTLPPAYASVFAQIRTAGVLTGWMTLLLPLILGWLLARGRQRFLSGMESWQHRIADIVSLLWLEKLLRAGLHYLSVFVGFGADILDGAGQFGWVLVALLLLWLITR